MLKNLPIQTLDAVYTNRLELSHGAAELIGFLQARQIKTAVVSGGFSYFTERLQQQLALDYQRANQLQQGANRLTGKLLGGIVNAQAKANFVHELCRLNGLSANQVLVAGDGANDLAMMAVAGVSVAYHAKPIVQQQADIVINFAGLDKMIDFFHSE